MQRAKYNKRLCYLEAVFTLKASNAKNILYACKADQTSQFWITSLMKHLDRKPVEVISNVKVMYWVMCVGFFWRVNAAHPVTVLMWQLGACALSKVEGNPLFRHKAYHWHHLHSLCIGYSLSFKPWLDLCMISVKAKVLTLSDRSDLESAPCQVLHIQSGCLDSTKPSNQHLMADHVPRW